ncbi:maltooligosyltrehalose trehalohydrolase [Enhydrobacter aerosaccus]|uniref:Malto-oligosyltrehalose trehalohydrolase n=1 Tax=Enhydrobacter aerosaccus TaxID=225324 RepID=A0A1T4SQH0_9HYPH|nr:malto-oligosyltrehalose trehalohydrolase [Enhydrobacter aerosaccus]SKA30514.1 maltooligosyltrehalose trehalohydrolase [Enhydrobacter aerosaccus]
MTAFAHPFPFGAAYLGDGRTRFRLWAPRQQQIDVVIDGSAPQPMTAQAEGWFELETSCAPGAGYLYRLGSGQDVPDPGSRGQATDVHGPSVVVDPNAYRWRHPEWRGRPWTETVLYELHAGIHGGFTALQSDLPRLAALGVTAVELMPINDFCGTRNWGYDGVLPFAPDRAYGTPDELKALIDEAHAQGLMMFLDVVYNHFGPEGNYLGLYAPQFFRDDIHTPWGSAIDFRQQPVRRFFIENALYWLNEYRFDGLRFDAVHAIDDQAWLDEMAAEIRRRTEKGRHVHLVLEHDGNEASHLRKDYDAQWDDDAHHVLHVLLTGESDGYYSDYADRPAEKLARYLTEGFIYQGEPSPYRKGERRGTPSADLPLTSFVVFLQNHDQVGNRPFGDRLTTLADPDALMAAIALQLLSPHIPLLFMGEEQFARMPFQFFTDYHGTLADAVREGRRREFAAFSGFGGADIPDPNARETFDRCRVTEAAEDSFYRGLLTLRHELIVPRLANTRAIEGKVLGPKAALARWRLGDGAVLSIATNFEATPVAFVRPSGVPIVETRKDCALDGQLAGPATIVFIEALA